ncbi:hypothetical protein ACQP1W_20395 [Spirillospora sp. CA-255316]
MVRSASKITMFARLLHRLGPPPPTPRRRFAKRVELRTSRTTMIHHGPAARRHRPR